MPDENTTHGRRRVLLPVLLASVAAAVALPVSAALAGSGDGGDGGANAPVQQSQERERPQGHDCPDEERGEQQDDASDAAVPEV